MICISVNCPKYAECEATVPKQEIEECEPFDTWGYGSISKDETKTTWFCGPLGGYAMFRPKNKEQREIEKEIQRVNNTEKRREEAN